MMKILFYISIILCCSCIHLDGQQQSLYSAFAFNKLSVNPASLGIEDQAQVFLSHRNQWAGLNGAPQTNILNYSSARFANAHAWAAQLSSDKIGIQTRYDLSAYYSFGFSIGASHIRLGTNLVNSRFSVDYTSPDIFALDGFVGDPAIDREVFSSSTLDFGLGIFLQHKYVFGGFSVNKILGNKIKSGNQFIDNSESRLMNAILGANIILNKDWMYKPQALLKISENTPFNLDILNMFSYMDKYHMGLNIRSGGSQNARLEAFDGLVAIQFTEKIMAGLSYEINVSELKSVENGSLDLFVQYRFDKAGKQDSLINIEPDALPVIADIGQDSTLVEKDEVLAELIEPEENKKDSLVLKDQDKLLAGDKISFNNILYEFDSYTLLKGATKELDDLSILMKLNPDMRIRLSSYTDSRGSELYNLELSNKRALSAKDYLIAKGIDPSMIIAVGYGESEILNHCKEGVKCTDEEHNFNRRTEVQIIKD